VSATLLATRALEARYGDFQALFGIDLEACDGEIVAVIGANGAGKSTLLKTIAGLLRAPREAVRFAGEPVGGLRPGEIARRGIALVPEGRRLFASLSVEENLRMGTQGGRPGPWDLKAVYELFPALRDKSAAPATSLSGGQQQMVAIGRALMANPRLLMCDEISLGLAPIVVKAIYDALSAIAAVGLTAVIVEQDVGLARLVSDRLYCLQEGRVVLSGPSDGFSREDISRAYFGVAAQAGR
jgi:branched-chain amino acid transport system ATP-binding protein